MSVGSIGAINSGDPDLPFFGFAYSTHIDSSGEFVGEPDLMRCFANF